LGNNTVLVGNVFGKEIFRSYEIFVNSDGSNFVELGKRGENGFLRGRAQR
jgi:hypothetical protein